MSSKTTSKSAKGQSTPSNSKLKQGVLFSFFSKKPNSNALKSSGSNLQGPSAKSSPHNETKKPDPEQKKADAEGNKNEFKGTIGQRVEVYWPDDDSWYAAIIAKQRGRQHFLEYDDGDTEWIDLRKEQVRLVIDKVDVQELVIDKLDVQELAIEKLDVQDNNDRSKRRRIQIDDGDDGEEEFKFDDDISSDESEYQQNEAPDEAEDEQLVIDDDANQSTPRKRNRISKCNSGISVTPSVSLSQFKADNIKITEYKASSPLTSEGETASTPKIVTPNGLNSTGKKTPIHFNTPPVLPMSSLSSSSPIAGCGIKSSPPMFITGEVNPPGSHVHNHLKFLQNPKDSAGRTQEHPEYDKRTLRVDEKDWFRVTKKDMTAAVKQWWDLKSQYFDTILFFKTGKFYELFHMDTDIGVQVCGLIYMKGHMAHCGFPEIGYGRYADKLVRAGYKVARVEQTETPDQLSERKKKHKGKGEKPKVVNREVCSIMTIGTRTFCYLDQFDSKEPDIGQTDAKVDDGAGKLLAIKEILLDSDKNNTTTDDDDVQPVCEYGITMVDSIRGTVTIGQFADDVLRSRIFTLISTFSPGEILLQGGEEGASETLTALMQSLQATSHHKFRIELINNSETFPRSTALDAQVQKVLNRCSSGGSQYVHPWDVQETLAELHSRQYYRKASKQIGDKSMNRWPEVLRNVVEGGASLALSSFGACLYYLQRNLIDYEILSMGIVEAYIPPEACNASDITKSTNVEELTPTHDVIKPALDDDAQITCKLSIQVESTLVNENEIKNMSLDGTTLHNLEILTNSVDHKVTGSLWSKLNFSKTPHGSRLLRAWLLRPLFRKVDIDRRLDAVEELISGGAAVALEEARSILAKCGDIERLLSRVHSMTLGQGGDMENCHPSQRAVLYETVTYTKRKVNDFAKVLHGLKKASQIPEAFAGVDIQSGILKKIVRSVDNGGCFPDMVSELDWFFDNFDTDLAAKGLFEPGKGIDELYDQAQDRIDSARQQLTDYKDEMCADFLKPKSLAKSSWKYINTSLEAKDKYLIELPITVSVPSDFILKGKRGSGTKQVNKYSTRVIDDLVEELELAYEVLKERKSKGMQLIFAKFDSKRDLWAAAAYATAFLDALGSLAQIAVKPGYCRPKILDCPLDSSPAFKVVGGRHPCIESCMGNDFIPNDLNLGLSHDGVECPRSLLLSGPNMGGKSTLLRQTCLLAILSQLGSFVPAEECELTPVDRIFTRLGASDRILLGQSTFFVELAETAAALRGASRRSLVIMDELGRGTSTFDGTAIASATLQHLVERSRCLTLFATHYHSLLDEWKDDKRVKLGHMECLVESNHPATEFHSDDMNITFLYTLGEGTCPKSFGINVARLAGLPHEVLLKAKQISADFENEISGFESKRLFVTSDDAVATKERLMSSILHADWDNVGSLWQQMHS